MGAIGQKGSTTSVECCGRSPTADKHTYSVWLIPDRGEKQEKLEILIKQTAWEFSGPAFDFHVRLCGGIERSNLSQLKDDMQNLARSLEPFQVLFPAKCLEYYDTWNQNVLLKAASTSGLDAACMAAHKALKDVDTEQAVWAEPCQAPHASLIYGEQNEAVRKKCVEWVREKAPWVDEEWHFDVNCLALYETDGGPVRYVDGVPLWRLVGTVPLVPSN